jgi:hypothetical protein
MPARLWAVATAAAALIAAQAVPAGADPDTPDPTPTPTPTVTPTPTPSPTASPTPTPIPGFPDLPDFANSVIYVVTVTTTVTTTTTTAPITVVAAPITTTTTTNNNTNSTSTSNASTQSSTAAANVDATKGKPANLEINLRGCKRKKVRLVGSKTQLRLPRGTSLVLRVNGRRVGVLDLNGDRDPKAKPLPLRIQLRADGRLSVYRPSGKVLQIQGCSAR